MPTPSTLRAPTPNDPAVAAALGELALLGLPIARVASRLADIEQATVDALADANARAIQAFATPPDTLEAALNAGRDMDACDAARDASSARIVILTACYEKTGRAMRRTAALQARLHAGRPFTEVTAAPIAAPTPRPHLTNADSDAEPADRPDPPEPGEDLRAEFDEDLGTEFDENLGAEFDDDVRDELGDATEQQVTEDTRRDFAAAKSDVARLTDPPGRFEPLPPAPRSLASRPPPDSSPTPVPRPSTRSAGNARSPNLDTG